MDVVSCFTQSVLPCTLPVLLKGGPQAGVAQKVSSQQQIVSGWDNLNYEKARCPQSKSFRQRPWAGILRFFAARFGNCRKVAVLSTLLAGICMKMTELLRPH